MIIQDLLPNGVDIPNLGVEHNPKVFENKMRYKMINWKTSVLGALVLVAKFAETQGWVTLGLGEWLVATITSLIGFVAADSSNTKK